VIDRCQTYGLNMEIEKHKRDWIVTISKRNDRTFTAPADARSPILRRAVLQAACQAHFQYDEPYLGREPPGGCGDISQH
jgi:hypothetical protein